jgi:Tol biopolymer transport system component
MSGLRRFPDGASSHSVGRESGRSGERKPSVPLPLREGARGRVDPGPSPASRDPLPNPLPRRARERRLRFVAGWLVVVAVVGMVVGAWARRGACMQMDEGKGPRGVIRNKSVRDCAGSVRSRSCRTARPDSIGARNDREARCCVWATCLAVITAVVLAGTAMGQRGTTERVTVSSSGEQGESDSGWYSSLSADGRFVAFQSNASNLVAGDTNDYGDVFVRDRLTGATELVSLSSSGKQANRGNCHPSVSRDGRFVAFYSDASNLVAGDTNGYTDIFLRDRLRGTTERISVSSSGEQGNGYSYYASVSADGRFVAFQSGASNLVAGDTNDYGDVFVRDRLTGTTELVSLSSWGDQGNSQSYWPSISPDGRFVAFDSDASDLVPDDTNGYPDIFVRDRLLATTERLSVSSSGEQANKWSHDSAISGGGRFVAFWSYATNLVPGDTNGEADVFVRDRLCGVTERASVAWDGCESDGASPPVYCWPKCPSCGISVDGRFVAFFSDATNLVPGDTNGKEDVFVRDRLLGTTERASVSSSGGQVQSDSFFPSTSADGRHVLFHSYASDLVPGDTNGCRDVFVHQIGSGPGWGDGDGGDTGGNSGGNSGLIDGKHPCARPVILVNGLSLLTDAYPFRFYAQEDGYKQWDSFKYSMEDLAVNYRVYDPSSNPNGNVFVCNRIDTAHGVAWNARRLNEYLESVRNAPALQSADGFDLVGYSMGGLIARHWEQKYDKGTDGDRTKYDLWSKRLANIVTINTPHLGSPIADALWWVLGLDSVADLRSSACERFNHDNPGLPGTQYSNVGSDVGTWRPGFGKHHDFVVKLDSQLYDGWVGRGIAAYEAVLDGYAHMDIPPAWTGVLNTPDSAFAVRSILLDQVGALSLTAEDSSREALWEQVVLMPAQDVQRVVPIADAATEAAFGARWEEGSAEVSLIEPRGRTIDPVVAGADPNIDYEEAGGVLASYLVRDPAPGVWTLRVLGGGDIPGEATVCDLGVSDDAEADPYVTLPAVLLHPGQSGRVRVELNSALGRMSDGAVTAMLYRPDGTSWPIAFYDDGMHQDFMAFDGAYASDLIIADVPGTFVVRGQITGSLTGFGTAARMFTAAFDSSPETAHIVGLEAIRPVDDPDDADEYYDLLNVDVNLQVNEPGSYTLSAELVDSKWGFIDAVSEVFDADEAGQVTKTLSFRGAMVGEHDKDGPYRVVHVRLTDETEIPVLTDYVYELATTEPYSKLQFETVHARAVAPPGWLHIGLNLISFPLDPVEPYTTDPRSILGGHALMLWPAPPLQSLWAGPRTVERGQGYWVAYAAAPPVVSYLGTQEGYEFPVELAEQGMHLIGCPYNRPLPLWRCVVEVGGQMRTAEQDAASGAPWVNWDFRYLQGGKWKHCVLTGGQDDRLRPWYGYQVTTNVPGITLTLRD